MKDKRKARRRPMRYTAWIALDGEPLIGCALSNISDTGARIDAEHVDIIPDLFTLLLSGNGAARRRCRVVWRKGSQIGLQFEARLPAAERADLVPALYADEQAASDQPENA